LSDHFKCIGEIKTERSLLLYANNSLPLGKIIYGVTCNAIFIATSAYKNYPPACFLQLHRIVSQEET